MRLGLWPGRASSAAGASGAHRPEGARRLSEGGDAAWGQGAGERQEETGPGRRVEGPGGPLYNLGFSSVWAGRGGAEDRPDAMGAPESTAQAARRGAEHQAGERGRMRVRPGGQKWK